MRVHEVTIANRGETQLPREAAAYEAELRLAPSRTHVSGLALDPASSYLLASHVARTIVWVSWRHPLHQGDAMQVLIEYVGERPIVEQVTLSPVPLWDGLRAPPEVDILSVPGGAEYLVPAIERRKGAVNSASNDWVERYRQECRARLDMVPVSERRQQLLFFLEYDLATHTTFLPDDSLTRTAVTVVGPYLQEALFSRMGHGAMPQRVASDVTRHLASLQLEIFREFFSVSRTGDLDTGRLLDAFIEFAAGTLKQSPGDRWNGMPDSANFFLFAEFALLALAERESRRDWMAMLAIFVACQPLYGKVFAPYCNRPARFTRVPEERRSFAMHDHGVPIPLPNIATLILKTRRLQARLAHWNATALAALHVAHATRAFPLAGRGEDKPCDALDH